jgi:hypothetical protein
LTEALEMVEPSWETPEMNRLESDLLSVLAASGVPPEDQSSILHWLASRADHAAFDNDANLRERERANCEQI